MSKAAEVPGGSRAMSPGAAEAPAAKPAVSSTATLIAGALVLVFCLVFWRAQTVLGKSIAGGLPPVWAVLGLLILAGVRPWWNKVWFLRRLSARRILLVYALFLVGSRLWGVEQASHYVLLPHYLSETDTRMEQVRKLLPWWWGPRDPERVAVDFYEGREDEAVEWDVWVGPTAVWTAFLVSCFVMAYCVYALFYRQWTQYERLSYPFLQLPLQIIPLDAERVGRRREVRLFMYGFTVVALYHAICILHAFNPSFPSPGAFTSLDPLLTERPWDALRPLTIVYKFDILGFAYLIPAEVSLSAVLGFFGAKFARVVAVTTGRQTPQFPYFFELVIGGYIVIALHLIWVSRRHLWAVLKKAVSDRAEADDSENFMSYRMAVLGFIGTLGFNILFLVASGADVVSSAMMVGIILMFLVVTQRTRAEVGVPIHVLHPVRWEFHTIPAMLGGERMMRWFGLRSVEVLNITSYLPGSGLYIGAGLHTEAVRLCDLAGVRMRSLSMPMTLMALLGVVSLQVMFLSSCYKYGWLTLGFRNALANPIDTGPLRAEYARPIDWQTAAPAADSRQQIALGVGAGVTLALVMARHVWLRFPIHPLGLLLGLVPGNNSPHWLPFLLAGSLKRLIYGVGGLPLYRITVPFFVGMGTGHLIVGGALWGALTLVIPPDVAEAYMVWFG